jgi:hypothetical protein
MRTATRGIVAVVACTLGIGPARAGTILTFDGLKNFEAVGDYFDGGLGSLGSGPGPDDGITFSSNGLAYIPGLQTGKVTPFPGDPAPPTVLLLAALGNRYAGGYPLSLTMDVSAGFSQELTLYDIAILRPATAQIWSGLDGQGTLLAQVDLPLVPVSDEDFTGPLKVSFSGTAHSVVFTGGNDQLAVAEVMLGSSVPEPASWVLLATGLGGSYLLLSRRRRLKAPAPAG